MRDAVGTSLASRTMLSSGLVIFAFLIFHLLHFTAGVTHPDEHHLTDAAGRHDVYSMVVLGFQHWTVSLTYIVAMLFLGLHLSHAAASVLQTFGLVAGERMRSYVQRAAVAVAAVVMVGNISIPLAVLSGLIGLPEGVSS